MNNRSIFTALLCLIFIGCGGGGDEASNNTENSFTNGYLIDSYVEGVAYYRNGDYANLTDSLGKFSYKAGETITFKIGELELGFVSFIADDEHVTLQDLCGVRRDVVEHPCVLNLATTLQSLDSDNYPRNGIKIEETARTFFNVSHKLQELDSTEINVLIQKFGKNVRSQSSVISHLKEVMQAQGITPQVLDENTLPPYYDTKVGLPPLPQN
jgi:hypothetical protein